MNFKYVLKFRLDSAGMLRLRWVSTGMSVSDGACQSLIKHVQVSDQACRSSFGL